MRDDDAADSDDAADADGLGLTCARVFWLTCARARRPHLSTRFWSHARTRKTRC